ncbi:MAG: aminotransferase class IV [Bacteroidales bacterium]|nr:aminotransferase class IV [Bacteroidales bacterium]
MDNCLHAYFVRDKKLVSSCDFNADVFVNQGYVYEVIRVIDAIPLFLEDHLQRMWHSLLMAQIEPTIDQDFVKTSLSKLISINKVDFGNIKIVVGKPQKINAPNYAAWFQPHSYPTQKTYDEGVSIGYLNYVRESPTAKIWRDNYQQLVAETKAKHQLFEVLLSANGKVTEGSKSNFFIVKDDRLFTSLQTEVLNGITRIKVISLAREQLIEVVEKSLSEEDIAAADALFLTGTSPKILPVNKLYPEKTFDTQNKLMRKLMQVYDELIAQYIIENKLQ